MGRKRSRTLENKNKRGDKTRTTRRRYWEVYTKPSDQDCKVMLEEWKTKQCQNKLQQLQWKEQGKEEDHERDGNMRWKYK